ncbi:hypothetical protein D3C73_1201390 [compost metagenome]
MFFATNSKSSFSIASISSFTKTFLNILFISIAPYTSFVETPKGGLTKTSILSLKDLSSDIFSPIPSHKHVPPLIQYGISAPSFTPRSIKSCSLAPTANISFRALSTAAAFVLPPAKPAATGMFLTISICIPLLILYVSINNLAALYARFLSSFGT